MLRPLAIAIVLLAPLAPPLAHAQVNIDEGKTPAHIFSSDCAVCHKTTRGLAHGRGNFALTGFLSEHYTSSGQEAAALAAYVLAGGGDSSRAPPGRGQKSEAQHLPRTAEKPSGSVHELHRSAKPGEAPRAAKPKRRAEERKPPRALKPVGVGTPIEEPELVPPASIPQATARRHELPATAPVPPKFPETEVPEPGSAAAAPDRGPPQTPTPDAVPTSPPAAAAASPTAASHGQPAENGPASRDDDIAD